MKGGDVMLNFAQELRVRRKAAKLSLKALGSISGVSDSTISKIEKEESSNLRWDTVCVLTKALNFTEDEFLELAGYPVRKSEPKEQSYSKYDDLTDEERREADLFIEFLLHRKNQLSDTKENQQCLID